MKQKRILAMILILFLPAVCLSACRSAEYLHIQEHIDPFSYKDTTEAPETEVKQLSAADYYSLRTVLLSVMTDGVEHTQVALEDYSGDLESDLKRAAAYMTQNDPVGAYAIDYIDYELLTKHGQQTVEFDIVYRRSASEIAAIRSVRGNEQADKAIYAALEEFAPSLTLQISGYAAEDFAKTIQTYCLYHPDKTVPCEEVSVSVYPENGNVRVVEFHFSYELTKTELRTEASETATALASAYNYIRYGQSMQDCAKLALSYLVGRFVYTESDTATVHSLLCEGVCSSRVFSSAFAYLCESAQIPCYIVEGTKQGTAYDWVMLWLDGVWYHFDVSATVLNESREMELKYDSDMTDYDWEKEAGPVCDGTVSELDAQSGT